MFPSSSKIKEEDMRQFLISLAVIALCGLLNSPVYSLQFDGSGNPVAETSEEQRLLDKLKTSASVPIFFTPILFILGGGMIFHGMSEPSPISAVLGMGAAGIGAVTHAKGFSSCMQNFSKLVDVTEGRSS